MVTMDNQEALRLCPLCREQNAQENETYCPLCIRVLDRLSGNWRSMDPEDVREFCTVDSDEVDRIRRELCAAEEEPETEAADNAEHPETEADDSAKQQEPEAKNTAKQKKPKAKAAAKQDEEDKSLIAGIMDDVLFSGVLKSKKKTLRTAVIMFILALLLTCVVYEEPFKYWQNGGTVKMDTVDKKEIPHGSNKIEYVETMQGNLDGQIVQLVDRYYEYPYETDSHGYAKTEWISGPYCIGGEAKVYYDKRKGKWRAATHCEPKDVLLCTLVPAALLFFGIYLTKKYFTMRKEENAATEGAA